MLTPEQFGAKGDGQADDAPALQAAFDRARGSGVTLRPVRYRLGDTVLLPTDCRVEGHGARLIAAFDDRPIVASASYLGRGPTHGRLVVRDVRIIGTSRGARQDGLVVLDYWSELSGVEVTDTGGRGIVLESKSVRGETPSGTLVETAIRQCRVRNARGTAFWLGAVANGKLTDGYLTDCIASLAEDARATCVHIGHAAGWTIAGLHTYGGHPERALDLHNAYFTSVSNVYVETFRKAAVAFEGLQTTASLTGLQARADRVEADAAFLLVTGHGGFTGSALMIANASLWYEGRQPLRALVRAGRPVEIAASGVVIGGAGAGLVQGREDLSGARSGLPTAPPAELRPRQR